MARSDQPSGWFVGPVGVVLSAGFHAFVFFALGVVRVDAAEPRAQTVEFTVIEEQPPAPPVEETPPAPEPEPEPEPVKPLPRVREAAPKPVENAPPPDATPPAAAEETIADFSGTTLTGAGEGGWVSAVGSGAPMNGPIGKPGAAVTGRNRTGVEGGAIGGEGLRVLGEADLSRQPRMVSTESFERALQREYPRDAQQQGIAGVARIRVRVLPSGKLTPLAVLSETYPGFGEACKRTVRTERFDPPLDRAGQPVATDINFSCTWEVD